MKIKLSDLNYKVSPYCDKVYVINHREAVQIGHDVQDFDGLMYNKSFIAANVIYYIIKNLPYRNFKHINGNSYYTTFLFPSDVDDINRGISKEFKGVTIKCTDHKRVYVKLDREIYTPEYIKNLVTLWTLQGKI